MIAKWRGEQKTINVDSEHILQSLVDGSQLTAQRVTLIHRAMPQVTKQSLMS